MNCEQVQSLLVSYLHHETSPSERTQVGTHVSTCVACQKELALLSAAQSQLSAVLQRRAAHAAPASDAWERLEARLAQDAQPAPSHPAMWISRLELGVRHIFSLFLGDSNMNKRYTLAATGLLAFMAVALIAFTLFNNVTPVSAQQIIERATAAQSAAQMVTGIRHYRIEIYRDPSATGRGTTTSIENYEDFGNRHFRWITRAADGTLLEASAVDGDYWYASDASNPLLIRRTPQSEDDRVKAGAAANTANADEVSLFEHFRNNPGVELQGMRTLPNGGQAYVLVDRNFQHGRDNTMPTYLGSVTMVFDATTYQLLESETTVHKDGKDIMIEKVTFSLEETLPAGTSVAWDLSDLPGVSFVDDVPAAPQGEASFRPITLEELATHAHTYALKTVPTSFTVSIIESPDQAADQPYAYEIHYNSASGEDFSLQAVGIMDPGFIESSFYDGSYKAASGMVLNYSSSHPANSTTGTSAMLTTPDGVSFLVFSTMSREQVEALVEDLVPLHP